MASQGRGGRVGRLARGALAIGWIALLGMLDAAQAQTPTLDYGRPPPEWAGSDYGLWERKTQYLTTGRTGYTVQLSNGQMIEYGNETIVAEASLDVDRDSGQGLAGFGERAAVGWECESPDDGRPVTPQVEVRASTFHGYPATEVWVWCRYPGYAWSDVTGDQHWRGGATQLRRLTCFEATPGAACSLISESLAAWTNGPAALGENAERPVFDALVAEVDAWKARWTVVVPGGDQGSVGLPLPAATRDGGPAAVCETYCLNGVSVDSPFCDCAPSSPPEPPDDDTLSLVIGLLTTLGVIGGGGWVVTRLVRRRLKPPARPAAPAERVLVDALGRRHHYVCDRYGRYINPETGGELNEAQWQEYNRNLIGNRRFVEQERQKQAARAGTFDRGMDQMVERQKQVERDLRAVQRLERSLLFNPDRIGLWRRPGEPGDAYINVKELRRQLARGEAVDRRRLDAVRRLYRDHVHGKILTPDEIPSDMDHARDVMTGAMDYTLREIATQRNADGGMSLKAMGLRLLVNVATLGKAELVLTPLESVYTMHDYVQQGGNSVWEGFKQTAIDVIKGEVYSRLGDAFGRRLAVPGKPKPQLPRARTPKVQTPSRYARAKGVDIRSHMTGMPQANIRRAQQLAQKHNVQILVRPTNPEARALLEKGLARPKPMMIKNKTINQLDTFLGTTADDMGKVGHFKPKLPPKNSVPPDLYDKIKKRYLQRWQEFRNQAEHIKQLQKQGKVVERNGVLYEALADGRPGKPYTGDHDLFEILDAHGRPCPESLKQHVVKELQKPPFDAQHAAHVDWDLSHYSRTPGAGGAQSPYDIAQGIDNTIRQSHAPGGEPLINFQPGTMQPIEGTYYTGA